MGVEIELKEWISGEEGDKIEAPITDVKFKINALGQGNADINIGEAMKKSTEIAVNVVVLKVDKKEGDIWKRIRTMPKVDYKFILKEVENIVSGIDFTKPVSKKEDGID